MSTNGLSQDQLVADVVKNERPDLAELRANLVVQIAADKAVIGDRRGWPVDGGVKRG